MLSYGSREAVSGSIHRFGSEVLLSVVFINVPSQATTENRGIWGAGPIRAWAVTDPWCLCPTTKGTPFQGRLCAV